MSPPQDCDRRDAAGALFTDAKGRILLVEPNYKPYWDLPGGVVEPGESPREAAEREIKEELGLSLDLGCLLVVDWLPATQQRAEGFRFVFDGGILPADIPIHLDTSELRSWAWCRPGEIAVRLANAPILFRRVTMARGARRAGRTFYLENGTGNWTVHHG